MCAQGPCNKETTCKTPSVTSAVVGVTSGSALCVATAPISPEFLADFNPVDVNITMQLCYCSTAREQQTGWVRDNAYGHVRMQLGSAKHDTVQSTTVTGRRAMHTERPLMHSHLHDPLRCKKLEHTARPRHTFHSRLVNLNQHYCTVAHRACGWCNVCCLLRSFPPPKKVAWNLELGSDNFATLTSMTSLKRLKHYWSTSWVAQKRHLQP